MTIRNVAALIAKDTMVLFLNRFRDYTDELIAVVEKEAKVGETDKAALALAGIKCWQLCVTCTSFFKDITKLSVNGLPPDKVKALNEASEATYKDLKDGMERIGRKHFGDSDFELANNVLNSMPDEKGPPPGGNSSLN